MTIRVLQLSTRCYSNSRGGDGGDVVHMNSRIAVVGGDIHQIYFD
jgi:hypothetical protein